VAKITDLATGIKRKAYTKFVFIGAGGGSLPLLESQCSEGKGYGGFPVSGQWLKCTNPDVIAKHKVKVRKSKCWCSANVSSTYRFQNDKWRKQLLFGPFAGFLLAF
jgi:malate dehydrogenase (quinone)